MDPPGFLPSTQHTASSEFNFDWNPAQLGLIPEPVETENFYGGSQTIPAEGPISFSCVNYDFSDIPENHVDPFGGLLQLPLLPTVQSLESLSDPSQSLLSNTTNLSNGHVSCQTRQLPNGLWSFDNAHDSISSPQDSLQSLQPLRLPETKVVTDNTVNPTFNTNTKVMPAIVQDPNATWASRNPQKPVQASRHRPSTSKSDAARLAAAERSKTQRIKKTAIHDAIHAIIQTRDEAIAALAEKHSVTVKSIAAKVNSQTSYVKSRKVNIFNALVSKRGKELNAGMFLPCKAASHADT